MPETANSDPCRTITRESVRVAVNSVGRRSGGNRWKNVRPEERLLAHICVDDNGCWQWQSAKNKSGYGSFWLHGRHVTVHRAAYIIYKGPIPEGLEIDHLCRNRGCVNPEHLEAVTARENKLRGNGWSGRNARKTHCPQGHEYTDENTSWYRGQRKCRTCHAARERARRYRDEVADKLADFSLERLSQR